MNAYGQVIGINTFIISGSGSFAGAGFAIPSQIAQASAEAIIKNGTVHHGYLGISMNDVTPDNSSFFNLPDATGAIVSQVTPDSPAGRAGLEERRRAARDRTARRSPTAAASGCGERDGSRHCDRAGHSARRQAGDHSRHGGRVPQQHSEVASNAEPGSEQRGRLGLAVANLTPDLRQQFNVPERVHGAVDSDRCVRAARLTMRASLPAT